MRFMILAGLAFLGTGSAEAGELLYALTCFQNQSDDVQRIRFNEPNGAWSTHDVEPMKAKVLWQTRGRYGPARVKEHSYFGGSYRETSFTQPYYPNRLRFQPVRLENPDETYSDTYDLGITKTSDYDDDCVPGDAVYAIRTNKRGRPYFVLDKLK